MPISEVTQTLYKTKHFGIACAYFVNKYKRQLMGGGGGGSHIGTVHEITTTLNQTLK